MNYSTFVFLSDARFKSKGFGVLKKPKSNSSIWKMGKISNRRFDLTQRDITAHWNQNDIERFVDSIWKTNRDLCERHWQTVKLVIKRIGKRILKAFLYVAGTLVYCCVSSWTPSYIQKNSCFQPIYQQSTQLIDNDPNLDYTRLRNQTTVDPVPEYSMSFENQNISAYESGIQNGENQEEVSEEKRWPYVEPMKPYKGADYSYLEKPKAVVSQEIQQHFKPGSKFDVLKERSSIGLDLGGGFSHVKTSKAQAAQDKKELDELRRFPKPKFKVTNLLTPWFKDFDTTLNAGLVEMSKYELWLKSHNLALDGSLKYHLDVTNYKLTPKQMVNFYTKITPLKQTLNVGFLLERPVKKENVFQAKLEVQNYFSPSLRLMDTKQRPNVALKTSGSVGLITSNNTGIFMGVSSTDVYRARQNKTGIQFSGFIEIKSQLFNNTSKKLPTIKGGWENEGHLNQIAHVQPPIFRPGQNNEIERIGPNVFSESNSFNSRLPGYQRIERVNQRLYAELIPRSFPSFSFDQDCLLEVVDGRPVSPAERNSLQVIRALKNSPPSTVLHLLLDNIWEYLVIKLWRHEVLTPNEKVFLKNYTVLSENPEFFIDNDQLKKDLNSSVRHYNKESKDYVLIKQLVRVNGPVLTAGFLTAYYNTTTVGFAQQIILPIVKTSVPLAIMAFGSYSCLLVGLGNLIGSSFAASTGAILGYNVYRLGFPNVGHVFHRSPPLLTANDPPIAHRLAGRDLLTEGQRRGIRLLIELANEWEVQNALEVENAAALQNRQIGG